MPHYPLLQLLIAIPVFCVTSCSVNTNYSTSKQPEKIIPLHDTLIRRSRPVFPQIHAHLQGTVSEFVFKMFEDEHHTYWFCTNHDGILAYDGNTLRSYSGAAGLGGSAVRSYARGKDGTLWFGTSGGLIQYDGKAFTHFSLGNSEQDNEVWATAIDRDGTLWIGTNTGVIRFYGKAFERFSVPKAPVREASPMLSQERMGGICVDSKGMIWFITDGYGITRFDGENFTFLTTDNGLTDNQVAAVFEDSRGNIWIGTFNGGVSKYDGKKFTNFTKDGIITGNEVYNFCEDRGGNVWFSAEGVGVYRYDGKTFTQFTVKDGLTNNTVQHIYADRKGRVWFCTWQGISIYDGNAFSDVAEREPWTR